MPIRPDTELYENVVGRHEHKFSRGADANMRNTGQRPMWVSTFLDTFRGLQQWGNRWPTVVSQEYGNFEITESLGTLSQEYGNFEIDKSLGAAQKEKVLNQFRGAS